ncbi:hypothetical protein AA313_de0202941 [Arthrobotrys entomopaga]|nr:hypothetical protein AA313_de0202941 [Arthrobotrys entomopaga]
MNKDQLLKDIFGEEIANLPSTQDRWSNIKHVIRASYKAVGHEHGFLDKRWTELSTRWKSQLAEEVLLRLPQTDRQILENRPDIIEKLLKEHAANREDWKKARQRKGQSQEQQSQSSPQPGSSSSAARGQDMPFFEQLQLPPLSSVYENSQSSSQSKGKGKGKET